jgi:hypothetical protein
VIREEEEEEGRDTQACLEKRNEREKLVSWKLNLRKRFVVWV